MSILNLGCITQDWRVPFGGAHIPVVLGYADPNAYRRNPAYLGAIVGRVANRIGGSAFTLGGQTHLLTENDGANQLHGGPSGLSSQIWEMEGDPSSVELRLTSPSGDQGYPGIAQFYVKITLSGQTLTYDMNATVDRPTPINLAQHNYYNLMGTGDVLSHGLKVTAQHYTPTNANMIPTGDFKNVSGSMFDFTKLRTFACADPDKTGHDVNYVLDGTPAACVTAPNGLCLELNSDQPGLQLYTAQHLELLHKPIGAQLHDPFSGFCLEPQQLPNAVNTPGFGDIVVTPDKPYRQVMTVRIFGNDA